MNYTIIIPTYMRPECLRRILGYYESFGEQFHIILADSSEPEVKKINSKIVSSCSNVKVIYMDCFSPTLNPHHKFAETIIHIKDPYCVICADDDFIVPTGVKEAVNFLEKNSDFTCAHGNYIGFKYNIKNKIFYWKPIYPYTELAQSDATERFQSHLKEYYQTLYAVHRTDFAKMIYQELINSTVDPMQFGELLPDLLSVIYGKMKKLDVLYSARAIESRVAYWPTLFEYMNHGKYESEYLKFKVCLVFHLLKNSTLDEKEANLVIDTAMDLYLRTAKREDTFGKIGKLFKKMNLPTSVDEKLKLIYGKLSHGNAFKTYTTEDPQLKNIDDFRRIRDAVLESFNCRRNQRNDKR
jgi:glycosyltransferase domain-containing protein